MMDDTHSHEEREEEDEEYEEVGRGNRLLGFMFGNVDNAGDLDVDYLDEDAKEHLSALADKLGPSLTDMDLMKSSRATTNASEQYYDEKAEDAIDYEDIDEQYDGPEIQAATENDDLLPSREYFSSDALFSYLNHKASIFDEDDYDEVEEAETEIKMKEHSDGIENLALEGGGLEVASVKQISLEDDVRSCGSLESEVALEPAKFQEEDQLVPDWQLNPKSESCLPILCIEDGMEILKFSEIFGIHEPLKKADRKYCQKHPSWNGWEKRLDIATAVEEDEEAYLRSTDHDLSITRKLSLAVLDPEEENDQETSYVGDQNKDVCLCSLPMKDDTQMVASTFQCSLLSPKFYPLDQQSWEEGIIWGNSPQLSYGVSDNVSYSENDIDAQSEENLDVGCWRSTFKSNKKGDDLLSPADVVDPIGSVKNAISTYQQLSKEFHHQLISSVSFSRRHSSHPEEMKTENVPVEPPERNTLRCVDKLSLKNEELLNGSWVDHIIWDSHEAISKPKLIFDLQDEQMLFEILDHEDSKYLSSCAGAMVEVHPSKYNLGEASDVHNQGMSCSARFNISNDKYYSSRKISQQAKSHSKKRASHGIKVLHSVPALRLQTMKPKLSNKDIANFHRPKALWYPHNNEAAAKARGTLCTNGQFKIVLMALGGRGIKLHVDAEETLSSVKLKASKKLGLSCFWCILDISLLQSSDDFVLPCTTIIYLIII
ncbi:Transcription initiation factor TFIID subunit 1 [Platanthera guangdongensis]|uniref:Transcription initiation factor TFIID subunit 1 n=1 Tax=Platanthera guangdongensis TaxID=2320717 RepID=A0ABR2LYW5_9ASPA